MRPELNVASEELEAARPYLIRYAVFQLRDATLAEDVVQDTLLAALGSREEFAGKSSVRTWLVGILRHKIIDAVRRRSREQPLMAAGEDTDADAIDTLFESDGHWREFPSTWGDPEKSFENRKFWETVERCLEGMPERAARVFMMREVMDLSSEEICRDLAITSANLWVLLHRARAGLRACLETRWFQSGAG